MTAFARCMMVKQYLGEYVRSDGRRFRVFATGDDRFFLFDPLDRHGCSLCCQFPVRKARLPRRMRGALNHGCSYHEAPAQSTYCRAPKQAEAHGC